MQTFIGEQYFFITQETINQNITNRLKCQSTLNSDTTYGTDDSWCRKTHGTMIFRSSDVIFLGDISLFCIHICIFEKFIHLSPIKTNQIKGNQEQ